MRGTSLENPQRISTVLDSAGSLKAAAVVVSAMAGVTNALTEAARVAPLDLRD